MEYLKETLRDSKWGRWIVLSLVSFTMLCSYYLTDAMAPLQGKIQGDFGWSGTDYGIYTSGYAWFNVFLLMLIFAGFILDKMGVRFTGILAIVIMVIGAAIKYFAFAGYIGSEIMDISMGSWHILTTSRQVAVAGFGFAIFGVGCEMFGIAANKAVVRWFRGKEMALAIGLNTSTGRIGTALAMFTPVPLVKLTHNIGAPVLASLLMLCIGLLAFIVFCVFDKRLDKEESGTNVEIEDEEPFRLSDIKEIVKIPAFIYITVLCLLFYSSIFPFLKYATDLIVQKFGISSEFAGYLTALLPMGSLFLTPIFGSLYDRKGKGVTIMIIGATLLVCVHLLFAIPSFNNLNAAVVLMVLLGVAFSLVPSAMWPSIAKFIPEKRLGTAYSITFWIQNWGILGVPLLIGYVLDKYCLEVKSICNEGEVSTIKIYDYTIPMLIFASFGLFAIVFAFLIKKEDKRMGYGLEDPNIEDQ